MAAWVRRIGEHRAIAVVVAVAVVLRALAMVAYYPALFFSDSWSYVYSAWGGSAIQLLPDRPSGYGIAIKILGLGQHVLTPLITVQHLAGLATGVLVYALLAGRAIPRLAAAIAAAVVLLDANTIGVEQHVMPEAFFTLAVLGAILLTSERPGWRWTLPASGLLLSIAVLLRTAGLFVVPVWLVYVLGRRFGLRATAVALVVFAVPLVAYSAGMQHKWHKFGLNASNGRFLYGRAAQIARCGGLDLTSREMQICRATEAAQGHGRETGFFLWDPASPAIRAFPHWLQTPEDLSAANTALGHIGRQVIMHRPLAYAGLVAEDFGRFFAPGETTPGNSDSALELPTHPLTDPGIFLVRSRDRFLPGYDPPARAPAGFLHGYQKVFKTPRVTLALLLLAALVALVGGWTGRLRPSERYGGWDVFLLAGGGAALLLGSVLTSAFVLRYLLPAVPLIVCGGVLAVGRLVTARGTA